VDVIFAGAIERTFRCCVRIKKRIGVFSRPKEVSRFAQLFAEIEEKYKQSGHALDSIR
jgi:hypothetical protein